MRIAVARILEFFPRLFVEFLPGLFIDLILWLFRRHERHHFVADEVVFEIAHPAPTLGSPLSVIQANVLAAVRDYLPFNESFLGEVIVSLLPVVGTDWRSRLKPPPVSPTPTSLVSSTPVFPNSPTPTLRIVTIPAAEPFSLVPVRVAWHSRSGLRSAAVGRVLQGAYAQLQTGPIPIRVPGTDITFNLQSISPNWLSKNLHHGGSTGGPGSWPLEATAPRPATAGTIGEHEFRLEGSIKSLDPYKDRITGNNVYVVILDTIPTNTSGAALASPLIQYLFDPTSNPHLNIHPYSNQAELRNLYRYTPLPYHYQMPDHGTYIAGIIHTIAPNAIIHLHEVLNSFGLGTLTSMTQGLINAVNSHYKEGQTSLIINCSFVLDLIIEKGQSNLDKVLDVTDPKISGLLTKSTRGVFAWATGLNNVVVVAAAGNEAKPHAATPAQIIRPDAKYPAAFQGIVGVGALPKEHPNPGGKYTPASYSNLSFSARERKSANQGFMTFGGELDNPYPGADNVPISTKGVLGVYIGEVLDPRATDTTPPPPITTVYNAPWIPSTTRWGHWAGTSFAAPIITGLLAAPSSTTTLPVPDTTAEGENVILIRQGP